MVIFAFIIPGIGGVVDWSVLWFPILIFIFSDEIFNRFNWFNRGEIWISLLIVLNLAEVSRFMV